MSFTRLTVRTRIACVLLPLVAVIVVLATLEVRQRLDRAQTAASQTGPVELAVAATDVAATHAQLALAALEGLAPVARPDAEAARARLEAVIAGSDGADPLVGVLAADLTTALDRFDAAVAATSADPSPADETPPGLAPATRALLATVAAVASVDAADVDAGGADLEPALIRLQAHDAAAVLGLELAAGAASDIEAAADRLDAALARAEVVERGAPEAVTADLRAGALSQGSVDRVADGAEPDEGMPDAVAAALTPVAEVVADDLAAQLRTVEDASDDARRNAFTFAIATAAALALALGLALLVTRSITGPLRELTDSIDDVTKRRLPRLVERLRSPDDTPGLADELTPVPVRSNDEIGRLATAFNDLQQVTGEVAEQQANLLRTGISDLFVNLARRNQALIERQLRFIDELEAQEEDPDRLRNLFELDHLATRMRRNAESLLVIAGSTPGRRAGAPIPIADVVRIAAGEIEQYQRVVATGVEDVSVRSTVAADLAHLLAELLDNAAAFSPPGTLVEVTGQRTGATYFLVVADHGDGVPAPRLAELNEMLLRPPAVGLDLARTLGMTVVARLAHRHGIAVRLVPGEDEGLIAQVLLPAWVLESAPVLPAVPVGAGRTVSAPPPPAPLPVPAQAATVSRVTTDDRTVTPDDLGFVPGTAYRATPASAPSPAPSALPVRTVPAGARDTPIAPTVPTASLDAARRSPEEVRRTLARYRSGLARGRSGSVPDDEGADGTSTQGQAVNE